VLKKVLERKDVIIIGGGPAGMSAALWCADLGLKPLLIEQNATPGGQLLWTHNAIKNYLGAEAANGAELALKFSAQVEHASIELVSGGEVTSADLGSKAVICDGQEWLADAVVIATGVRRKKLGVPGEAEFDGRGILVSGARDRENVRGKRVVIIGGGDAALENALTLSETATKVYVVHRRRSFGARDEFISRALRLSNVEFVLESVINGIGGDETVRYVTVENSSGITSIIKCDAVLIRIGVEPNTGLFAGQIELNENGYVVVDEEFRTTAAGVWAIGDVIMRPSMTLARAVGNGAEAAKSIFEQLRKS
jgi:thioredoxin reductase (NADPH)